MKNKLYCYFFLLFIGLSCINSTNNKIIFSSNEFKTIKGKQISPDLFIGQPLNMYIIEDKILIIDIYENKQITIIDTDNINKSERIGTKGDGPNEFINIRNIIYNPNNKTIGIFDGMTRYYSFYNINNKNIELSEKQFISKIRINGNYLYDIIPFKSDFIANGCFNQKQFALLDNKMNCLSNFGIYPGDKKGIEISGCFFLKNQTIIAADPNQNYLAAAGIFHDQLSFYKKENGNIIKIKEYFSIDSKIKTSYNKDEKTTQYSSSETSETVRTYRVLYPTNSFLYALYWGLDNKDLDKNKNDCYILKFDWNGVLKTGFKITGLLKTFAVDEKNNSIYGITDSNEDESILIQYKM